MQCVISNRCEMSICVFLDSSHKVRNDRFASGLTIAQGWFDNSLGLSPCLRGTSNAVAEGVLLRANHGLRDARIVNVSLVSVVFSSNAFGEM